MGITPSRTRRSARRPPGRPPPARLEPDLTVPPAVNETAKPPAAEPAPAGEPDDRALPGCATVMRQLGGDPAGTAAFMRAWLLIEQPGPWPQDALERVLERALPPDRRERLERLNATHGLRPLLIRRPGRHHLDPRSPRRTVLVGAATPGGRWLEALHVDDLAELASLDLDAVANGEGGHGRPVAGPAFLVCTHGTKDLCCALLGRPLATALDAEHPGRVWETSHVGGDRWAGNLLVVPDGFMHGQLAPDEAARVAKAALDGGVEPDQLRGRTAATPPAQAAEVAVRRRTGLRGLDAVLAADERALDGEPPGWAVLVAAGPRRFLVTIRHRPLAARGYTRCAGLLEPSGYAVERVEPVAERPCP
jgi:hypothetical protein